MIKQYPELEIYQPTIINGKNEKKDNMFNLFDTIHDPKTKRYFGETLVSVKDGQIWAVKYMYI